ncbi:lipopolysaccharide assembly protein LapB [Mesorhizobium sp. INR15]|uniref:tetratricopeptide repeat protein n=1 Tax=Mesorhizobium sp. INR15 TaxID=2654248 RepID=UPI001896618F|nr:tetratricopeptide repeat protein [Mesorhizobium sp. INR15]QPC93122.1 tetratricopeptide repeat protein [Mesorhizobium sp. INR15]
MAHQRRKAESTAEQPPETMDVSPKPQGRQGRLRDRFSLAGFDTWSTTVRSIFLNALFLIAILVVVPVLVGQFRRDEVVIEPIAVPEALSKEGLTADVAASRIWDGLQDVTAKAKTSKASISAIPQSRRVEFSFPDSGFSIESLIFHVRRLFNAYETRISGEFVCSDSECARAGLRLRLRVVRDTVEIIDLPPIGDQPERQYFADAASNVMANLDPFVAIAADAEKEPLRATTLARRLIRSHHKDAKWAYNLVGLIRYNASDLPAAIEDFRAAIALDTGFLPARLNLGNVLRVSGDLDGAEAEFSEVRSRDAHSALAIEGFSDVAMARKKPDEAIAFLIQAADLDPENPRYYAKAGKIELDRRNKDKGVSLLRRSLELDPGYIVSFAYLASMYIGDGNYEEAEKVFRDAADYSPSNAEAQAQDANLLALLHKWDAAAERYDRARTIEPGNAAYWLEYARCLQALGKQKEALAALDTAVKLAPDNAEIYSALGDSYRGTDRKPEAIAAYKKFLELDKTNAPSRPIIQRFIEILSG